MPAAPLHGAQATSALHTSVSIRPARSTRDTHGAASTTSSSAQARPSASFNLIDAPWIPVVPIAQPGQPDQAGQGTPRLVSLRALFHAAPQLAQIADPSPVVTISLYRLLLAILHRSLQGPRSAQAWADIFAQGAWDTQRIDAYLTRWHDRFDLFDLRYPFYQTPGLLVNERTGAATTLAFERASGRNQPLLFDHTTSDRAWLTPAAAARALLAQQNFAAGGLISYDSARETIANKYVSRAPLLGTAICLVRGSSLFETLMLNWVRYDPDNPQRLEESERLEGSEEAEDLESLESLEGPEDLPAWERETATAPVTRTPRGIVDLLTWQSRRILLIPGYAPEPELQAEGALVVERAALMKGYQFSPEFARHQLEPMIPFARILSTSAAAKRSKGPRVAAKETASAAMDGVRPGASSSSAPITLQSGQALWRLAPALFQSVPDARSRPATLDWLSALTARGARDLDLDLDSARTLTLDLCGMIPDQATVDDWRCATLPLPLVLLTPSTRAEHTDGANPVMARVEAAVALAEAVGRLFRAGPMPLRWHGAEVSFTSSMSVLAEELLKGISDRIADRSARDRVVARFGAETRYWSHLEQPFRELLLALAQEAMALTTRTRDDRDAVCAYANAHLVGGGGEMSVGETGDEGGSSENPSGGEEAVASPALRAWAAHLAQMARQVFHQVMGDLDSSARTLRAAALAQSRFNVCLAALLTPYEGSQNHWPTVLDEDIPEEAAMVVGSTTVAARSGSDSVFGQRMSPTTSPTMSSDEAPTGLTGVTPEDQALVAALVALYHRKGLERESHNRNRNRNRNAAVTAPLAPVTVTEAPGARNFGASLRTLTYRLEGASLERRLMALLVAPREDLPPYLRHAVALLSAHGIPVNWSRLLHDLSGWSAEDRHVQRAWARAFWRRDTLPHEVR